MGRVNGETLQCGYHGLKFDASGTCVGVPSQDFIPPKACVKSYPILEQYGWVWVWMGETSAADTTLIPDFGQLTDPAFGAVGKTNHVLANYRLVSDNLLDLSHVGFVHTTTIGNAEMGEKGKLTVERAGAGVRVLRNVPDVPPPPSYIKMGVLPEGKNIDRWQVIDFIPPCFVKIHVGGKEAGTGALEGDYAGGLNLWILNAMTPETEQTTQFF
jgi:vanillate O-demethylase monooxygenase subunit